MSIFAIIGTVEQGIKAILDAGVADSGLKVVYASTGRRILDWARKIDKVVPCASIEVDPSSTPSKLVENVLIYTQQATQEAASVPTLTIADAVCDQLLADLTFGGILAVPAEFAGFELHPLDGKGRDELVFSLEMNFGHTAFVEDGVAYPEKRFYIRDYEAGASDYTQLNDWTLLGGVRPENGFEDDIVEGLAAGMTLGMENLYTPSRKELARLFMPMSDMTTLNLVLKRDLISGKTLHWRDNVTPNAVYALLFKWRINKTTDLVRYWPRVVSAQKDCDITAAGGAPLALQASKDETVSAAYATGYSTTETI